MRKSGREEARSVRAMCDVCAAHGEQGLPSEETKLETHPTAVLFLNEQETRTTQSTCYQ